MGKREVGMAGGIAAASALGVARFADNCAAPAARIASSNADDAVRLGGRSLPLEGGVARTALTPDELAARGVLDDPALRAAASRKLDGLPPVVLDGESAGALGHGAAESRVAALPRGSTEHRIRNELIQQGLEQALESTSTFFDDDEAQLARNPKLLAPTTQSRNPELVAVEELTRALERRPAPHPLAILGESEDRHATIASKMGDRPIAELHAECITALAHCVVITCRPQRTECAEQVRAAWTTAVEQAGRRPIDEMLTAFYVQLALSAAQGTMVSRIERSATGDALTVITRVR